MAKLGDIATYINGYAFKPQDWSDEGIPIIRIQDLTGNSYQANRYNGEYASKYEVNDGDVLISWSASLGVYIWHGEKAVLNQHIFKVVFDKERISKDFFVHQVGLILENAASDAHGATMKHLTKPVFDALPFYLPPYEKQCEIAGILDKVTSLISLRKQQLAKLDELVKARFVEMFGDPINNPMKWIISKIEDITAQEKNALKAGPFGSALKKEFYVRSGYKIYGQEQVICGDASFGDYYIDEEKYKELKNCAVQAGDILISLVGTYGKTLIMPDNYEAGIINPRLMKITLNKNKVTPIYFKYYFESNALKASMDANTHGGTMGILNLGIIRQMKIQVPPLSLQNQFAAFVERVDQQKQTVQQSLEKLELMKKALMQEYFG
jgi:type I restriction enzyme S subunit